jgi:hypothetical protein
MGLRRAIVVVGLLAAACGPTPLGTATPPPGSPTSNPPPAASPSATATDQRDAGWRSDLESLVPEMARLHPNLTHGTSRAALDGAVTDLIATIPTATDDELMAGVLRIVAMVSAGGCDAHTGAFIWGTGTYPVESLPLRVWLFPYELGDALTIVDALPPYRDLIGSTIDTIEGKGERDVRLELAAVIPRDNDSTLRLLAPRYVLIPQVLRGLGVADAGPVTLGLTTPSGDPRTVDVDPIPMVDYNAWAGPYGLHLPADPDVLYLSRIDDPVWWSVLLDADTLYVQYNRVEHLTSATLDGLRAAIADPGITRVVLDLRHNYGGEVSELEPFTAALFAHAKLRREGGLVVITGRNTFSAGSMLVARLDARGATIVGEPMGGCPTLYGDSHDVVLPYSGIAVSVATELSVGVRADDRRATILPDIPAPLTFDDWLNKRDPALLAIAPGAP